MISRTASVHPAGPVQLSSGLLVHRGQLHNKSIKHASASRLSVEPSTKNHIKRGAFQCLRKYSQATTLHGFKYVLEKDRPLFERITWLIILTLVYTAVGLIIAEQLGNFFRSPVLISFASVETPVSDIELPAITFCPDSQIRKSSTNLSWAMRNPNKLNETQKEMFWLMTKVCHMITDYSSEDADISPATIADWMRSIIGQDACELLVMYIKHTGRSHWFPCQNLQPMLTKLGGACFSYNMFPHQHVYRNFKTSIFFNWSSGQLYDLEKVNFAQIHLDKTLSESEVVMDKVDSIGIFLALTIPKNIFDDSCFSGGSGFVGFVHSPREPPGMSSPMIYVADKEFLDIRITPTIYKTDRQLLKWTPDQRGCYDRDERYLQHFHYYSQSNCEIECEANVTLKNCGCVQLHHPRNNDTPVCGYRKFRCIKEKPSCHCLPSCDKISYQVHTTSLKRNWPDHITFMQFNNENQHSGLDMAFGDPYVQGITRQVMFPALNLIANMGGLLGLFLGFSILSFVEILYFLFFRNCLVEEQLKCQG